jgi:flavodoxin
VGEGTEQGSKVPLRYRCGDILKSVTNGNARWPFLWPPQSVISKEKNMKGDILIAYYSWSGNTRKIAELIHGQTGGALFEIEPVQPYTTDYAAAVAQAKEEIKAGFRPELKAMPKNTSYAVVFLGTPIWWHTMAPPLATFIDCFDLYGKTVVPFHTHGGGGVGSFENDIAQMCPNSTVTEGFGALNRGGSETMEQIRSWLSSIRGRHEKQALAP